MLLGVGAGGFFDGIVLHQVLQWHHLLSNVDAPWLDGLSAQVVADGVFHALMYVAGAAGLWLLLRARADLRQAGALRWLAAHLLLGFGLWHVVDAVLVHWILALHRIRMDATNPLAWDLAWLVAFGLVPIAIGWELRRRAGTEPHRRHNAQGS